MSIRQLFVDHFGSEQTIAVEDAAHEHENKINSENLGSDPFRWALTIVIGYECVSRYAEYHGITINPDEFKEWVRIHGVLQNHDGDFDYLCLFAGGYDAYM